MDINELLIALIPLAVLQLAVTVWAMVDLIRRKHVKGLPKFAWGIIIVAVTFGAIVYLVVGRGEE